MTYPGYTPSTTEGVASGSTITNTEETTEATANKTWVTAAGGTPPSGATVTFALFADGEATGKTVVLDGTADDQGDKTEWESAAWTAKWTKLAKYQTGTTTEIVYTIKETVTYPGYTPSTTEGVASGSTITNTEIGRAHV